MDKNSTQTRKKKVMNYVYATLIGLLVVACALTIALVTWGKSSGTGTGENGSITVSANSFVLPMSNATIVKDYSGKELQYNDTLKQWEIHKAIDFASDDTSVFAVANGTVSNIYTNYLEGTVVEITHEDGLVSVYKSLSSDVAVSIGDVVTAGQIIGEASNSMAEELNTSVHLHLEMLLDGVKVDPNDYLPLGNK